MPTRDVLDRYVHDHIYAKCGLSYRLRRMKAVRAFVSLAYRTRVACSHLRNRFATGELLGAWTGVKRLACRWLSEDMLLFRYYLEELRPSLGEKSVCLASEGVVHHSATVSVFAGRRCSSMSDRWLANHSSGDMVVIHLRVPPATAFKRLWQRGVPRSWPRKTRLNESMARETLFRFAEAIEESVTRFEQAGVRVLVLENSSDTAALAANVNHLVKSLVS